MNIVCVKCFLFFFLLPNILFPNSIKGVLNGTFGEEVVNQFVTDDYIIVETTEMLSISDVKTGNVILSYGGSLDEEFNLWDIYGNIIYDSKKQLLYVVLREKLVKQTYLYEIDLSNYPNVKANKFRYTLEASKIVAIQNRMVLYYELYIAGDTKIAPIEDLDNYSIVKDGRLERTSNSNGYFYTNSTLGFQGDIYVLEHNNLKQILDENSYDTIVFYDEACIYRKDNNKFLYANRKSIALPNDILLNSIIAFKENVLFYYDDRKIKQYSFETNTTEVFRHFDYNINPSATHFQYYITNDMKVYKYIVFKDKRFLFQLEKDYFNDIPIYNYGLKFYRPIGNIISITDDKSLFFINTRNGRIDHYGRESIIPEYNDSLFVFAKENRIYAYDIEGSITSYSTSNIRDISLPRSGNNFSYIDGNTLHILKEGTQHEIDTLELIKHEYFDNGIVYLIYHDENQQLIKTFNYQNSMIQNEYWINRSKFNTDKHQDPYLKTEDNALISISRDFSVIETIPLENSSEEILSLSDLYNADKSYDYYYFDQYLGNQYVLVRSDTIFEFNVINMKKTAKIYPIHPMPFARQFNIVDNKLYVSSIYKLVVYELNDLTDTNIEYVLDEKEGNIDFNKDYVISVFTTDGRKLIEKFDSINNIKLELIRGQYLFIIENQVLKIKI